VTADSLVALVCCDLGGIVRGRSVTGGTLPEHVRRGIGWVPANLALTPLGPVAENNPFGSTGDLRLLPDPETRVRVEPLEQEREKPGATFELMLCDIVEVNGDPWECCPREFLRQAAAELAEHTGLSLHASFEHEFQLLLDRPSALGFSLRAQREAEPFATLVMDALEQARVHPERFFAEYSDHQFEIPVAPAAELMAADRAVVMREVVHEVARREGTRATFTPVLDPEEAGNGVHIHFSLCDASGPVMYDPDRPGCLSEVGARFAAGILAHARALVALTAPSPVSAERLAPHHWSAGAVCLAERNREALLRIPPLISLGGSDPEEQMRLEYRGADATANPYLALGAIIRAGLDGIRRGLPEPPVLDRDPALLDDDDMERFGVGAQPGSLAEALGAFEDDEIARGWLSPTLLAAYLSVKRAEIHAAGDEDPDASVHERYAGIY
jgi:glutamine synthetase